MFANILLLERPTVGLPTQEPFYPHLAMCSNALLQVLFYTKHDLFYILHNTLLNSTLVYSLQQNPLANTEVKHVGNGAGEPSPSVHRPLGIQQSALATRH